MKDMQNIKVAYKWCACIYRWVTITLCFPGQFCEVVIGGPDMAPLGGEVNLAVILIPLIILLILLLIAAAIAAWYCWYYYRYRGKYKPAEEEKNNPPYTVPITSIIVEGTEEKLV